MAYGRTSLEAKFKEKKVGQNNPFCLGLLCKVFHRKKFFFFLPIEKKTEESGLQPTITKQSLLFKGRASVFQTLFTISQRNSKTHFGFTSIGSMFWSNLGIRLSKVGNTANLSDFMEIMK